MTTELTTVGLVGEARLFFSLCMLIQDVIPVLFFSRIASKESGAIEKGIANETC